MYIYIHIYIYILYIYHIYNYIKIKPWTVRFMDINCFYPLTIPASKKFGAYVIGLPMKPPKI